MIFLTENKMTTISTRKKDIIQHKKRYQCLSPQTVILDNLDEAAAKRYEFDSNFEDVCLPTLKRASSVPGNGNVRTPQHSQPFQTRRDITQQLRNNNKARLKETSKNHSANIFQFLIDIRASWKCNQKTGISLIFKRLTQVLKERQRNHRLSIALNILKQARKDIESSECPSSCISRSLFLKDNGLMGVALFSPLDAAFVYDDDVLSFYCTESDADKYQEEETEIPKDDLTPELEQPDHPVLEHESPEVLLSTPHILSESLMHELNQVLPCVVRCMTWRRVYSLNRDGDSFGTFLNKVQNHSRTLLVIRNTNGFIFGGFADTEWKQRANTSQKSFYGGEQS